MLYDSRQWVADIRQVTETLPELRQLAGKTIWISGASGLICSAIVDILICFNESADVPIFVVAAGRSEEKMKERFGIFFHKPYFFFQQYDATDANNSFPMKADIIIHGASNAYPAVVMKEPVETMQGNFFGLSELLNYARQSACKCVLYISSSEVYGLKENNHPFRENEYGFIDLLNVRNAYAVAKRAAETLCASFAHEYGVPYIIVRPGHIYGPTAQRQDNRVSSAWMYAAAGQSDIIMKSDGRQIRSYCYCADCASPILKVLLCAQPGDAYNIADPHTAISISTLAQKIADTAGVELKKEAATQAEKSGFNPMLNSSLDSRKLQALGWKASFDFSQGVEHTITSLRQRGEYS